MSLRSHQILWILIDISQGFSQKTYATVLVGIRIDFCLSTIVCRIRGGLKHIEPEDLENNQAPASGKIILGARVGVRHNLLDRITYRDSPRARLLTDTDDTYV